MVEIRRVGIAGAGTMGCGIAINVAQHGLEVLLLDQDPGAVQRAGETAKAFWQRAVERGRMTGDAASATAALISAAASVADLGACDLVIEAVFEDQGIKARLLEQLGPHLDDRTIVATNTSCLRVGDLARHARRPERFLGLHYFSPAQVNRIVEVVRGPATDDRTAEAATAFCRATGKEPIACKDSYGFAINRFFCPYTNEAVRALDDGLGTTGEIDAVARDVLGAAAGPFLVQNLVKPRINLHAIRNLAPLGPFYAPVAGLVAIGERDGSFVIDTPAAIAPDRRRAIADRLLMGCFLPVLQLIDEEVVAPADIDRGARQALKLLKPPCALMASLGRDEVARIIRPALDGYGIVTPRSLQTLGS